MQELLQLPLQVQATLVAGFLGYCIYKRDHRNTEKATDMLLLVLLFGLPTALILQYFDNSPWAVSIDCPCHGVFVGKVVRTALG